MKYLDAYDLILAFYGLNHHLNSVLRSCRLHVLFDETKKDTNIWKTLLSFIDETQIYFLSFNKSDESIYKRFLPILGKNLRSLSLQNISRTSTQFIFEHLPVMNQLKSLYIKNSGYHANVKDDTIVECIFNKHGHRFTSLTNCSLVLMPYWKSFPSVTAIFHHLRRLSLNDSVWTMNIVIFLLKNTPNLRSLCIRPYGNFSQVALSTNIRLNHIQELEIRLTSNTSELPSLLILFSDLQCLRIVYFDMESSTLLNGKAWQELIENHLPHLQRLTLNFYDEEENDIDEGFVHTFRTGEFWSKRPVSTKIMMNKPMQQERIVEQIYFGKPWAFDTIVNGN